MSATLMAGAAGSCCAACFCTLASSANVVGHTSGQCVKPKNTRVGWPRSTAGEAALPCVSTRLNSGSVRAWGSEVPDSSDGTAGWFSMRATYTPANAATTAMAPTEIQ